MGRLSSEDIDRRLAGSPWRREGDALIREWALEDFSAAMRFVNEVAHAAESANHHPDILVHGYNRVRLTLTTHSESGVTEADLAFAQRVDGLA